MTYFKTRLRRILVVVLCIIAFKMIPITYSLEVGRLEGDTAWKTRTTVWLLRHLADDNDTVAININSPGGYLTQAVDIANAINDSDAHTVCYNRGMALSGGAIISVVCDEQIASVGSVYLFHRPYYFSSDGRKILAPMYGVGNGMLNPILRKHVGPYLTDAEKWLYVTGGDVIISGDDWMNRLKRSKK